MIGSNPTAWVRAMNINRIYITRKNVIHVPFFLQTRAKMAEEKALLGSGATHNFIDKQMVKRLGLGAKELKIPRTVINVDGTANQGGTLTRYTDLKVSLENITEVQRFYITDLGGDRAIFGYPWLETYNPSIDWKNACIEGGPTIVKTTNKSPPEWAQISRIRMIGRRIAKKMHLGDKDEVHLHIGRTNVAQQWAEKLLSQRKGDLVTEGNIPTQYVEFTDVFSESAARRFPPAWEDDHAIEFKPNAPDTFSCKIYPISHRETEFLQGWIDKNLGKHFIRESKSPYASPTFLIKKKNGDFRVIQDYRMLNEHTVPDMSPLPLIGSIIDKLHERTLFTKFDIRWGYHNIRIRDGDQEKAAFKMTIGQYEPMVMNFRLRNAPATFQRLMNKVLRPVKAQYGEDVQGYMDDVIIATKDNVDYHREVTRAVLNAMRNASLFLKPEKCESEKRRIEYLGPILNGDTIEPDPSKVEGLKTWPTTLKNVKEVRSTLGVLNYNRAFIPGFATIAKPLTELLKKDTPFTWTPRHTLAVEQLIKKVTSHPVLIHPNPGKTFELEVNALNYATGAILFQKDERSKARPIGYHSKTFSDAERNYDIYDKELTAINRGLENWRHLLLGSNVIIHTDHANLTYYRHPHKLSDRARRAVSRIMKYTFTIKHKPGIHNRADTLSRRPDFQVHAPTQDEIALPSHLFVNDISALDLDDTIKTAQKNNDTAIQNLLQHHPLERRDEAWYLNHRLVVVGNDDLKRGVIQLYHDFPTAGHPGGWKTLMNIAHDYWWPTMRPDIMDFVKGCAICQATKPRTTQPKPPLYPITSNAGTLPFETIALDFITKLPQSHDHNSILSITDQGCSKAAIFLPCKEEIDALGVAKIYVQHVFPHYGIPKKVILDRDTRFTARFTQELCRILDVKQNISLAYHPQTDGQSERNNQWIEQFLRIYANGTQDDWSDWLPIAQYTHNEWANETTGKAPFELIMGFVPRAHQALRTQGIPSLEERSTLIQRLRWLAHKAVRHAQRLLTQRKGTRFVPYHMGDRVWLEGVNLAISHPAKKFKPRRYGPFTITRVISDVAYRLALPPHWKIHDIFHMSLLTPYHETRTHGPNLLEPPPDVIDGEPEWEVEEIIGVRTFGRRREKQYRVKWKGYNAAHDSWEPASNVHAPDLIEKFHKRQRRSNKGTTMSDEDLPTRISLIAMNPGATSHPSPHSSPTEHLIELGRRFQIEFTRAEAEGIMRRGEHQALDIIDQEAATTLPTPSPTTAPTISVTPPPLPLSTSMPAPVQVQSSTLLAASSTLPPAPPPSPPYMPRTPTPDAGSLPGSDSEDGQLSDELRYDDIQESPLRLPSLPLYRPPHRTGPSHPGWPWVARANYPESAARPVARRNDAELGLLSYIRLAIDRSSGDPTSYATDEHEGTQYACRLTAEPVPRDDIHGEQVMAPDDIFPESPLGEPTVMDPILNRALWTVPDAGIWANIYRLRAEDAQIRELSTWDTRVKRMEEFVRRERHEFLNAREQSRQRRDDASRRLLAVRATTKILAVAQGLETRDDFKRRRQYLADLKWVPHHPVTNDSQGTTSSHDMPPAYPTRLTCSLCFQTGHSAHFCENPHTKCSNAKAGYCVVKPHHKAYYDNLHSACLYRGRQPSYRRREVVARTEVQNQGGTLYLDRTLA